MAEHTGRMVYAAAKPGSKVTIGNLADPMYGGAEIKAFVRQVDPAKPYLLIGWFNDRLGAEQRAWMYCGRWLRPGW